MENIQDWASYLLQSPEHAQYSSYAYKAYSLVNTARSYATPLLSQLTTQITQKPDLATIALLLVIVLVSLKILDMLYQTVMFWFRLIRRVAFWGGLAVLGVWMYTRGIEGVVEDLGYWKGQWGQEYEGWKERERVARLVQQRGGGYVAGGGWR